MFSGYEAVICTALSPTKIYTGALLVVSTGWLAIE